jgi:hypothetical protein
LTDLTHLDQLQIPIVDLAPYLFSPPGAMGWSASEYERLLSHPEADLQAEPFSLPPPASGPIVEWAVQPDRRTDPVANVSGEKAPIKKAEPQAEKREKKTAGVSRAKRKKRTDGADYMIDRNPPAPPWLSADLVAGRPDRPSGKRSGSLAAIL